MLQISIAFSQQKQQVQINMKIKQGANHQQNMFLDRFKASMLLAAVGDSIGYYRGKWQFNRNGAAIHKEMMQMTNGNGMSKLLVNKQNFPFSDDTVMHIATAKGLLSTPQQESSDLLLANIAKYYKKCMKYMSGRAPGNTCIRSARRLNEDGSNWNIVPFQKNGGGCGASMRSACIGLLYSHHLQKLIEISIESGRITHHNPLGFLGSMVSSYFTSLAVQNIHPYLWFKKLMNEGHNISHSYISKNRQSGQNLGSDWKYFWDSWYKYGSLRKLSINLEQDESTIQPVFPQHYDVKQRQQAYLQLSVNGWPGALGLDSVLIAYDALISTIYFHKRNHKANRWQQICLRGMLHGGDSDSTGTIVAAWYGAYFGFEGVYIQNMQNCQGKQILEELAGKLYERWQQQIKKEKLK